MAAGGRRLCVPAVGSASREAGGRPPGGVRVGPLQTRVCLWLRCDRRSGGRGGFTLLEVLLAIGLMAVMAGMMFAFYEASLKARARGTKHIVDTQLVRTVAMQIAREIRSANGYLPSQGPGISGDGRMIKLQTVVLTEPVLHIRREIDEDPLPAQSDIREVQYYLAYDDEETFSYPDEDQTEGPLPLGLVRREIKTLNQILIDETDAEDVDLDLLAPELKYLRFRYFDGAQWLDKWDIGDSLEGGLGNSLPQAVQITVGYTALPPLEEDDLDLEEDPDLVESIPEPYSRGTYTVTVRLPQADTFFGSRLMRASRRANRLGGEGGGF